MRSPWKGRCAAALPLLLFLAALLPGSVSAVPTAVAPLVRASGPDPYASCAPDASGGPGYPRSAAELYVAVNPSTVGTNHVNLVGVWQQDPWHPLGSLGIVAATSFDGGQTWTDVPLPFTRCVAGGLDFDRASDPWVSIGPDGTVYAAALGVNLANGGTQFAILAAVSHDGGRTWSDAQALPSSTGFVDKDSITADQTKPGTAYAVWNRSAPGNAAMFSRTTDGGRTWSKPRLMIPPTGPSTIDHQILVHPRTHALYDFFLLDRPKPANRACASVKNREHPKRHTRCRTTVRPPLRKQEFLTFVASHNGGATWSKPHLIAQVSRPKRTGVDVRGGFPEAAIDPATGRLYVVWNDARFSRGRYNQTAFTSSADGGRHWSMPIRVSTPGVPAAIPAVAVNWDGVVGVTYYTLPTTSAPGQALQTDYWFASSRDHGAHFGNATHLAGAFDLSLAPRFPALFLGDYQGLAAGTAFYPFFVVTNPDTTGNRTDVLASSVVPIDAAVAPLTRVSGPSPYAHCAAGGSEGSTVYPNAEVEPRIAINPTSIGTDHTNLVGVWQQDRWNGLGARGIVAATSFDGGDVWMETTLPFTRCTPGGLDFDRATDPWVSIGPDGTVYASALGIRIPSHQTAVLTAVSHDGGLTWSSVQALPPTGLPDKETVTADPTRPGVAYMAWRPGSWLSETSDGGRTWSRPQELLGLDTQDNHILVDLRTGRLYDLVTADATPPARHRVCKRAPGRAHGKSRKRCRVVMRPASHYRERIAFMTSKGPGKPWSYVHAVAEARLAESPRQLLALARVGQQQLDAAVDPATDRLYAVWQDARFSHDRYDQIAISSSSDGGKHWSRPIRANTPHGERAATPSIAVNADGVVGVTYYTMPAARSKPQHLPTDYWFASSQDHGRHFGRAFHLAGPFDLATAPIVGGSYFLGDYQGLAAGTAFYPFFVTTNLGDTVDRTDVFSTSVEF